MTSRPRTAKKAVTEPTAPPAKRTAKKTAAKRTTGSGTARTRTPRKTTAATPALTLVKPNDKTKAEEPAAVDTRPRLAVRRRLFVGPMGPHEQAAIRAALASAALRLPVPVRSWNGSQALLGDGTLLIHNPGPDPDNPDTTARVFTAHIACRHGAIHGYPIANYPDLAVARDQAATCETRHSQPTADDDGIHHEYDWDKAITRGVGPVAKPKPSAVFQLAEGVRRAKASADKTQPLDQNEITEGLAQRAADQPADNDQTREHPQP